MNRPHDTNLRSSLHWTKAPTKFQNFWWNFCVQNDSVAALKIGASSQPTGLRANTLSPLAPTSGATCIWEMSPIANQPGVIPSRRPSTDVSNRCRRGKNASPQKNAVVWHFGWVDFGDKLSNHFSHLPNPVVRVQNALQSKCFLHSRVGYSMLFSFPASTRSQRGLYAAKQINKQPEHCTCSIAKAEH